MKMDPYPLFEIKTSHYEESDKPARLLCMLGRYHLAVAYYNTFQIFCCWDWEKPKTLNNETGGQDLHREYSVAL